jgi:hypothetical protein
MQKQYFERKLIVHFSKRNLINEKRKSNHKETNHNNPINSFNERKNKTKIKPMSLLNANENFLSNQQANEKHQALNSQPLIGSQPNIHTQLQKLERMNFQ